MAVDPWHDLPTCKRGGHAAGELCSGPMIDHPEGGILCAACGTEPEEPLTDRDLERIRKAEIAWEIEEIRQEESAKAKRDHDRRVPLLADALDRRRRGIT